MTTFIDNILYFLKKYGPKSFFIRKLFRVFLKYIYPNGIMISIGKKYTVKLIVDYIGYITFGDKHNKAWSHCIESLKPTDIFFDIGAHIGLYTLPSALKLKEGGLVYAFEPGSYNLGILKKHVQMNLLNNVHIYDCLVGDKNDRVDFFENTSSMSPKNSIAKVDKISSFDQTLKKQISLDEHFFKRKIYPNVIKIDVEGAELFVLIGAEKIIKKGMPTIYLSIHPNWLIELGQTVNQLLEFIEKLGYNIFDINMKTPEVISLDEYILLPK